MTVLAEPSLTTWLTQQRARLLADWHAAIGADHGSRHPAELDLLLGRLLDALALAAGGDQAPLAEQLRLARAFRTGKGEGDLTTQLGWLLRLRRVAREALLADGLQRDAAPLADGLDTLLDSAALILTSHWTVSANSIEHELRQAEMMAETLSEAAEQADQIAVQLANLNTISTLLSTSLDLDELLTRVGEQLFAIRGVAQVLICLGDGEDGLAVRQSWGQGALESGALVAGGEHDLLMQAVTRGTLVAEAAPPAAEQGPWYQAGCAVLAAPLLVQQHAIGVIVLQDPNAAQILTDDQRNFLATIASQVAIALQNAQLYARQREFNTTLELRVKEATRDLQTERDMLGVMHRISTEVSRTLDVDVLLQSCLDMIGQLVSFQRGAILLVEPETGHLVDRATVGIDDDVSYRYRFGQGLVGWVAQHKQPVLVTDVTQDDRWAAPDTNPDEPRVGALLAAPLLLQRELMGVIVLNHDQTGFFGDDHLRLLSASSTAIALGINNALLYDQQERMLEQQNRRVTTERRNSAQRDAILQSLSDGVIVCGDGGSVLVANRAASRILHQEVETLVTMRLPELLQQLLGGSSADLPVMSILRDPYDADGEPRHYEATLRLDQRVIKVSLDPVLLDDKFEDVIGAVAVVRDITREVESDRLKDEFIGTLSHELRTPMTSIKGYTQLMALGSLGPLNDPQRQFLETISSNTERMISIINDLLDITKIETGSVMSELDIRPLLLAESISTVLLEHTPKILARSQRLQLEVPMTLPLVRCDAKRLNQILTNVISNAVKYTPPGGEIAISATEQDEQAVPAEQRAGLRVGRYVRIDVRDTGVGIPAGEQELIFDRFYRVQNALTVEAGGTGLGLTMVRGLVRLFGGRIWLVSAPDAGTTISFVLPVA